MAKRRKKATSRTKKSKTQTAAKNRAAQWKAYRQLQMQADKAWRKFRDDVRKNARAEVLINDNNHMLLLLGECNYMARECMRMASKGKGKKRAR
ncbi:MAG: hypothetical protein K1X28_09000 [Parachlamydiales bacterium]|nr:hypothetical protein [Parachlamydiales bacterium]